MIKKKEAMVEEIRPNPKGGVGDVSFTHVLTQEAAEKVNLMAVVKLVPGQSIGLHDHQLDAEAMYVLTGHPSILDDGKTYLLSPGDATYCTGGHVHSLFNSSNEPATVLAIVMK